MASSSSSSSSPLNLILAVACFISLISPSISQTCKTQNVQSTAKTPFENCLDLPVLDSYLHYSYNASNSSLTVAFVGTQSQSNGWVSWAINPKATGMAGSQAFLAYRSGSAAVVKTYNISSYSSLVEGKLAFDFWDLKVEAMRGNRIAIFTSVKVPAGSDSVNQVWQIGGNVTNGRPGVHPFVPNNLNSRAVLRLTGADAPASSPGSAPSPSTGGGSGGSSTPGEAGGPGNAGSMSTNVNFGVNLGILVLLGSFFIF